MRYLSTFTDSVKAEMASRAKARRKREFWLIFRASALGFLGASVLGALLYLTFLLIAIPSLIF